MNSDVSLRAPREAEPLALSFGPPELEPLVVETRRILATDVLVLTIEAALRLVGQRIVAGGGVRVAFVNAQLALMAHRRPELSRALGGFLLLNDGFGVDLASKILYGAAFPANLNGTDFIPALLDVLPAGQRLYLLGSTADNISVAAEVFAKRWPQHHVVGYHHGYVGEVDRDALGREIALSAPSLVLVGKGNPKQELWLADYVPAVCPAGIGVGALFDFLTGRFPRAPRLVRKARLEWVFRFCLEPKRLFNRYVPGNVAFLIGVARQSRERRRAALARLRSGRSSPLL